MRSCILVLYIALSMGPGDEVRLKPDTTTDNTPDGRAEVRLKPDTTPDNTPDGRGQVRLKPDTTTDGRGVRLRPDPLRSDAASGNPLQDADPDALYSRREDVASARKASDIWAGRLQKSPRDFETAWKLARAQYWLGKHVPKDEGKRILESGIAAARAAIAVQPNRPEGHFWLAANMGALAESFGLRQGLKYRGDIKDALLAALKIDPAFQQGSADRALGRWYFKVPGLFGGSNKKSEEHLRRSLTYNPNSAASLYFLAETLVDMGRRDEARAALQKLIDAPIDPEWAPEDREFKDKAKALVAALSQKR